MESLNTTLPQTHIENNDEKLPDSKKNSLIICEVCSINQFKYKCPRCHIKSCSLYCVKKHKKERDCSGKREIFEKKSLNEITLTDLRRDMNFMNEAINETNKASKKHYEKTSELADQKDKSRKNMKKISKKFRNINLICCPIGIKKFSENKSYIDTKEKKFYWTLKFIFWNRESNKSINLTIADSQEMEKQEKLEIIFPQPFDDSLYTLDKILIWLSDNKNIMDLDLLMYFNDLNLENLNFLYKINIKELDKNLIKGKLTKIDKFYYEVCDRKELLRDVLNGKDVYEFPEFYLEKKIN